MAKCGVYCVKAFCDGSKSETEGNIMEEIKKAIQALGFRSGTVVSVSAMRSGRALVSINGDLFGIWDAHKKTFVD